MTTERESFYDRNRHFIPAPIRRWGRIAHSLYIQRVVGFPVPSAPHFDEQSTPFFITLLQASTSYLEFGSGGSTFLAATTGKRFTTIESDPYFLQAVQRKIEESGVSLNPETQRLIPVDIGLTESWGVPVFQKPTPARLERWRNYYSRPFKKEGENGGSEFLPDLILVDGRFRVACTLSVALHLFGRSGWTLLFDDYVGRPHYTVVEQFLTLSQMVGRMAVFTPKTGVVQEELRRALEHHAVDWR